MRSGGLDRHRSQNAKRILSLRKPEIHHASRLPQLTLDGLPGHGRAHPAIGLACGLALPNQVDHSNLIIARFQQLEIPTQSSVVYLLR